MIEQDPPRIPDAQRSVVVPDAMFLDPALGSFFVFRSLAADLPQASEIPTADGETRFRALRWRNGDGDAALAWLQSVTPSLGFTLPADAGSALEVAPARRLSADLSDLARLLLDCEVPVGALVSFLLDEIDPGPAEARSVHALLCDLVTPDGVIEVTGSPETGGGFAQGWTSLPLSGPCTLISASGVADAVALTFSRPDLLAPAQGVCLHAQGLPWLAGADGSVLLRGPTGLRSLTVLTEAARLPQGDPTTDHIREMLPKLEGCAQATAGFQRICRPRYTGADTLSPYPGAVAAALDCALAGPSGDLFLSGWLLDPFHRVDRVLLKGTDGAYARLDTSWHRTARADLNDGFSGDPRFAGHLDARETMHGFLVHVPQPSGGAGQTEHYLEIVLSDGDCLFQPLAPVPCRDRRLARTVAAKVPVHDPALRHVLARHVAPFLAQFAFVPAERRATLHRLGAAGSAPSDAARTAALMPWQDLRQLEPVLAALCGTPEADALQLLLAADDTLPADHLGRLENQFEFYGIAGGVTLVRPHLTISERLDVLLALTQAPRVLVWHPSALPKRPGWLAELEATLAADPDCALVSPMMTYEDATLHYSGALADPGRIGPDCQLAGLDQGRAPASAAEPVSVCAAELALACRDRLLGAGGLSSGLFGDALTHLDLSRRLRAKGHALRYTPAAQFWMLDRMPAPKDPDLHIASHLDAAILEARADRGRNRTRAA